MTKTEKALIYLMYCAANDVKPDISKIESVNSDGLYEFALFHSLTAPTAIMLNRAGIKNDKFDMYLKKTLRKVFLLDHERSTLINHLEENKIWYCPLKGIILKDVYGEPGLREMADNDILFDVTREQDVREIMLSMGYTEEINTDSNGTHDSYIKPPALNFEMHKKLFGRYDEENLAKYYDKKLNGLLIKDDNSYAMRFSDEDFYVFLVAHEYKHLCYVGTGLRSLLDRYVFLSKKGKSLDREYIDAQMRELKTDTFEKESGELAFKLFSAEEIPPLTDNEQKMLEMYLRSGTFGTYENLVSKRLKAEDGGNFSKYKYIRKRLFPSREYLAESVPFVKKSPLLYPVGYVWRIIKAAFSKMDRTSSELKTIKNYDKDKK